jgi:hypothetical protein
MQTGRVAARTIIGSVAAALAVAHHTVVESKASDMK